MDLDGAKTLLSAAVKTESFNPELDSTFVLWYNSDGIEIATGYFARDVIQAVYVYTGRKFEGTEAEELRKCFASELVDADA